MRLPGPAGRRVRILLATRTLAKSAEESLIREALEAWSRGELLVVSVDGAMPQVIRVLIHAYTDRDLASLRHVYLRDAVALRTDLADE